jgi:hypothetical protein
MTEKATNPPCTIPQRVVVIGCPGAGKTRFAALLARRIAARHIERDRLGTLGSPAFCAAVSSAIAAERWVFDGPPYFVEAEVYAAAQVVIWLDYRRSLILARAIRRALRRTVGPVEPGQTFLDRFRQWVAPGGPRFMLAVYDARRQEFGRLSQHPLLAETPVLRFGTPIAAVEWLAALAPQGVSRGATTR